MQITVDPLDERRALLRLDGRLDLVSASALRGTVDREVARGRRALVIDLGGVAFVDSTGLGALIAGLRRARQAGGELRIAGAGQQVLTVVQLLRLDRVLRPYETVESALEGLD